MKGILKYLFLLLLIILVVGGFWWGFNKITVGKISCYNQYEACSVNLKSQISNLKKGNIIQTRNELDNLLKNNKSVLQYEIQFQLPNNFRVDFVERKAIIAFITKSGKYALVDKEGIVVGETST